MTALPRLSAISSRDLALSVCIELHPHQPEKSLDLACPICNPVRRHSEAMRLAPDLSGSGCGNKAD